MNAEDALPRCNVAILTAAQAILGAQLPAIFVIAGLAGQSLAANPCFATLPISLLMLGSMLAAQPLSGFMQRYGRRAGFWAGTAAGAAGAAIAAAGLYLGSFPVLLLGSLCSGVFMSSLGFYRFAAADTASEAFRPKAISYVLAGGLASAVIGPQLTKFTADAYVVPFFGTYLGIIVLNLVGAALFLGLRIPRPPVPEKDAPAGRTRIELLKTPIIGVAIICAMVSYALMNLMMTSTPLAVVGCGFSRDAAADIVTGHVLAMYGPSFFTGHLIARFGAARIVSVGLCLIAGAGLVALSGVELGNFYIALILLGLGWNLSLIHI